MTLQTYLEELERLEKEATPAPWREHLWIGPIEHPDGVKASIFGHGPIHIYKAENLQAIIDSELISKSRNAIPKLLAVIRELLGTIKDIRVHAAYDLDVNATIPLIIKGLLTRCDEIVGKK
jgi:hypothetical protein